MGSPAEEEYMERLESELAELHEYDERHGVERDPYAAYEEEQRAEYGGDNPYTIAVEPIDRRGCFGQVTEGFYVDARQARCLAASLLRAADEAEEAL